MIKNNNNKTNDMLNYLKIKYGETFEVEKYEEGSVLFPELYGADKLLVHPVNNFQLPFYVFSNIKGNGFSDDYIVSKLSYEFTEKYKKDIEALDHREKAVKFAFGVSNPPEDPNYLKTSVDDFVDDATYDCDIYLYIAINSQSMQDIKNESTFLYKVYSYLKEKTDRNFEISVAYINKNNFADARELIRLGHAINFSWTMLEAGVLDKINFERKNNIKDASYFNNIVK